MIWNCVRTCALIACASALLLACRALTDTPGTKSAALQHCHSRLGDARQMLRLQAMQVPAGILTATLTVDGQQVPDFCRLSGVLAPVPGSRIGFELWLPAAGWNGRLLMLGNGGYSSTLPYGEMILRLRDGYAVAATDTGHQGDDPVFAAGNREAIVDWGHRAVHLTAAAAHTLVRTYYGRPARYRYFQGCSTGGHQGLMEVQRYPADFDGVIAGAPGHNRTHLNAGFLWQFVQNHAAGASTTPVLGVAQLQLLHRAALDACRRFNGAAAGGLAADPFLNDPSLCRFDPAVLACRGGDSDCLSATQVNAARRMYDGARDPVSGEHIYHGWPPGSELVSQPPGGWQQYWADPAQPTQPARASFWRHWVFMDPQWQWQSFDFGRDVQRADDAVAQLINANDPDIDAFRLRGGKLLQYHGTADPVVPFADSIVYHERVGESLAARTGATPSLAARQLREFHRLFLVPGMSHCGGGNGLQPASLLRALERWVEDGVAPASLTGMLRSGDNGGRSITRPLCPYPEIARHDGVGDPDDSGSFRCSLPDSAATIERPALRFLR